MLVIVRKSLKFDYFHRLLDPQPEINESFMLVPTMRGPPVISWFINPNIYIYVYIYIYIYVYIYIYL